MIIKFNPSINKNKEIQKINQFNNECQIIKFIKKPEHIKTMNFKGSNLTSYLVSDTGVIFEVFSGKIKLGSEITPKSRYKAISIKVNGTWVKADVHRIVCETFKGKAFANEVADHINGNREDNRASNLRWVSQEENIKNAARNRQLGNSIAVIINGRYYVSILDASSQVCFSENTLRRLYKEFVCNRIVIDINGEFYDILFLPKRIKKVNNNEGEQEFE